MTNVKKVRQNYHLLVFLIPAFAFVLIFNYIPMYGILIAFQNYVPGDPIVSLRADWVGLFHFESFINDFRFTQLMVNTFILSLLGFCSVQQLWMRHPFQTRPCPLQERSLRNGKTLFQGASSSTCLNLCQSGNRLPVKPGEGTMCCHEM